MWFLDRWWPNNKKDNINPNISKNDKAITITKLKMTNLITKRIINSKTKAADFLPSILNNMGKRLHGDMGDWWLREEDLTTSRRDTWPSWRYTTGTSSSCEEDCEYQEAVQH